MSPAPFPLTVHAKKVSGCPHEVRWVQDAALAKLRQIERVNDWTQQLARGFKLAARSISSIRRQKDSWVERGRTCKGQGLRVLPVFADDVLVDRKHCHCVDAACQQFDLKAKSCQRKWRCLCPHLSGVLYTFPHLCEVRARAEIGRWVLQRQE